MSRPGQLPKWEPSFIFHLSKATPFVESGAGFGEREVSSMGSLDSLLVISLTEKYSARNYKPLDVVLSRGEGVWVYDLEGRKYLDMLSCYSALNHGHRHPKLIAALFEQAGKITLTSRAFHNAEMGPFLKELCEYTGMDAALPMNTGVEAVETAIKAVRKWGYKVKGIEDGKANIIACANNFHGRTVTVVSFSTEPLYRDHYGPYTPGFTIIPYGDAESLKKAIDRNTVAFLVEPIQGEAGVFVPPEGFLREARGICSDNGVLLILDEIQTGFGRTGRRFCFEYEGIKPDGIALGKALGGGILPVSAFVGSKEILGVFEPGEHGSTFGGNPLSCAVGRASLKVLEEEHLAERAFDTGNYLIEGLRSIKSGLVKEVRGRGLLIGIELHKKAGGARRFCEALMKLGILCKETHDDVIRVAPPLVIDKTTVDWALERFEDVLAG